MSRLPDRIPTWLPHLIALLGSGLFLWQAWGYAHSQVSVLDEGLYLYKGWLFAAGRYEPFQDYGPWSNHMPLSFLIPGWVQVLFGPGLRTGRMLALGLSGASLVGMWLLVRRFGGGWWAAGAVWALAMNPAVIKMFSLQASQGLAACLLIWALVFTLGRERPRLQLLVGGVLAAAVPLARINLLPFPLLLAVLVYSTRPRRDGHLFSLAAGLVFLAGHAVFWPGILRLWAPWFPQSLTPFLDPFRRPANAGSLWDPQMALSSRFLSFSQGVRFHFIPVLAAVSAALFWPRGDRRPEPAAARTGIFLLALFALLFAMHAWAALAQDYCVFCFPVYLSFFSLPAMLLLPLTFRFWSGPRRLQRWIPLLILALAALIGLSSFDVVGPALLEQRDIVQLLKLEVPRTSGAGSIPLWGLIENRFGMDYETAVRSALLAGRLLLSAGLSLLAAAALLWLARGLHRWPLPFPQRAVALVLAAGLLFGQTDYLGGGYRTYDCTGDVIAAHEAAGARLADAVPPGAQVYWGTGESPAPLLYLPEIRIYPAQLNGAYSFKFGGDADALERFGHWNRALAERWAAEADVLLLDRDALRDPDQAWLAVLATGGLFDELAPTPPVNPCAADSQILIFVRK